MSCPPRRGWAISPIGVLDGLCDMGARLLVVLATAGFLEAAQPRPENGGRGFSISVSDQMLIRSLRAAIAEDGLTFPENQPVVEVLRAELLLTAPSLTEHNLSRAPCGTLRAWTSRHRAAGRNPPRTSQTDPYVELPTMWSCGADPSAFRHRGR